MHSAEEELSRAEAEASRLSQASQDKHVELEMAEEHLERLELSSDSDEAEIEKADREVERLTEEAAEVDRELLSAADYYDLVESRMQDGYDPDEEEDD